MLYWAPDKMSDSDSDYQESSSCDSSEEEEEHQSGEGEDESDDEEKEEENEKMFSMVEGKSFGLPTSFQVIQIWGVLGFLLFTIPFAD